MTRKVVWAALVLCILAGAGYMGAKWYVTRNAARQIDKTVAKIPEVKAVAYSGLDVALLRQNITLHDVTVTLTEPAQMLHIDRLAVDGFEQGVTIPSRLHVLVDGLDLNLETPMMAPARRGLKKLGYRRLKVALEFRYGYDEAAGRLDVEKLSIDVARMGKVELTVGMENLDIGRLKSGLENPLSIVLLIPAAAVSAANIQYRDASLVKRLLESGARYYGQSVPEYTRRISENLSRALGETQDPRIQDAISAVTRFLKQPAQISVRLSPEKPVPLLRLMFLREPAALAALFGLKIST